MRKRAPKTVEFPDQQRVAWLQRRQRGVETGTLEDTAADALVGKKLLASGSLQRVTLKGEILVVRRDSGVANKHREFSNGFFEPASARFDWHFFLFEKRWFSGQALGRWIRFGGGDRGRVTSDKAS